MAWAQKNYVEIQGINGKYKISQIGCFLTAFCNLLERKGQSISPPQLNKIFIDKKVYIDVDDGIRDDLGWGSISAVTDIVVTGSANNAQVPTNDSIVRLKASNSFGTHFCLVHSAKDGTIVDSWDGQIKHHSVYGPITGWASYAVNKPQPVQPIGVDMPTTLETMKALANMASGRNPNDASNIADLQKNHVGKDPNAKILEWYGSTERKKFLEAQAKAQESLNQKINDMQNLINSLSARPTKEEYAKVQAQINDKVAEITKLQNDLEVERKKVKETIVEREIFVEKFPAWVPNWLVELLGRIFKK